jgi:prepilin-type N-terminal cleavage/methylation domain-containing protein
MNVYVTLRTGECSSHEGRTMKRRGFTIVELLVVIAIIGGLLAIILPAVHAAREASRATTCKNSLRQLALGVDLYYGDHGRYPPGSFTGKANFGPDHPNWSWLALTFPYIEQAEIYKAGGIPTNTLRTSKIADRQFQFLRCPTDPRITPDPATDRGDLLKFPVGLTNYKAVTGSNWGADESIKETKIGTDWTNLGTNGSYDGQNNPDGLMYRSDINKPRRKADVTDGLSHTFMLGEDLPDKDRWSCSWAYANGPYGTCAIPPNVVPKPGGNYSSWWWPNVLSFRSAHPGGLHFAFADDRVAFVADTIDLKVYRALATIRGHETVNSKSLH